MPTPPISRFVGLSQGAAVGANPGSAGGPRAHPAARGGAGLAGAGRGPVTCRRKNASDPTWARFRDAGNIWGVCAGRLGKYLLPNLARRCSRMQTIAGLHGGWGRAGVAAPAAAGVHRGELTGGEHLGEGRIKHLEPGPLVRASLF